MKTHSLLLAFFSTILLAAAEPRPEINAPASNENSVPTYKRYTAPAIFNTKTALKGWCDRWICSFSRLQNEKPDMPSIFNTSFTIYKILRLYEKDKRSNFGIVKEEETAWLTMYGNLILDRWICDNAEDEEFKIKLKNSYMELVDELTPAHLYNMVAWAIEEENHLKVNWLAEGLYSDSYTKDAYDTLLANIIYQTLELLSQSGLTSDEAADLAMKATFSKYDGSKSPMAFASENLNFRAIEILLKWTDNDPVLSLIKDKFDPSDRENLFNNLWIVEILQRYGHTKLAKELVLIGDQQTQSILLENAIKSYSSLSFSQQQEITPLIRHIQPFVFE